MNTTALISFIVVIFLVVTALWLKRQKNATTAGLFFASKQLGFFHVGCALYFTNISATEFIGGSQSAYINNMSVMAWGVSSVFAMIIVSEFVMPVYLRGQMLTTPDFLEKRFGTSLKQLASVLFMLNYFGNILPVVLYGGAIALNGIFHFSDFLHINYFLIICLLILLTGIIGLLCAVTGGLKAIVALDIFFCYRIIYKWRTVFIFCFQISG